MVIQESRCETTVNPAAVEVSFPYALGTTTGLRPKGIASAQAAQVKIVLEKGIIFAARRNTSGMSSSRITETK